jgi:hypothetical protein
MTREKLGEAYIDVYANIDPKVATELKKLDKEFGDFTKTSEKLPPGLRKIEQGLSQLGRTATGMSPAIQNLVGGLSEFGVRGGVVAGAILGFTLLKKQLEEYTEEVRKAEQANDDLAETLFRLQQDEARQADPVGEARRSLETAQRDAAALQKTYDAIAERKRQQESQTGFAGLNTTQAEAIGLANLEAAQKRVELAQRLLTKAQQAATVEMERGAEAQARAATAADARAASEGRAAAAISEARRKLALQVAERLADFTVAETDDAVAQLNTELSRFQTELNRDPGNKPLAQLVAQLTEARDAAAEFLELARNLDTTLESVNLPSQNVAVPLKGAVTDRIVAESAAAEEAAKRQAERQREALARANELTTQISLAGQGAIDLARAFGGVSDETARTLDNLVQIAASVPQLVTGLNSLATGGLTGAITGGIGILGGIAGLFSGGGGDDSQYREALADNSANLRDLARVIGELGVELSGLDFAGALATIDRRVGEATAAGVRPGATLFLGGGADEDQLKRAAEAVGQAFIPTIEGLKLLREALIASEINQYARTFSGGLQKLQDSFAILDIDDPVKQLALAGDILKTQFKPTGQTGLFGIPLSVQANDNAIGRALAAADLTSQQGRQALEDVLRTLFAQSQTVDDGQFGAFFGDLSPAEFIDALTQITDLIDATQRDEGGQTVGFAQVRTITENTGERLTALLGTANYYAERTAQATEATARHAAAIEQNTALMATALGSGGLAATVDQQLAARASSSARSSGNLIIS